MKRKQWEEMDLPEKIAFLEECADNAKKRFLKERDPEAVAMINQKIEKGYRLSPEEFEIYTGISFSWTMGGKMKDILSLSTCCLLNPLCRQRLEKKIGICAECFAEAEMLAKQGLLENSCYNFIVLSTVDIPEEIIPFIDRKEFRLESFGDVATVIQCKNYIKFALYNKHCAVSVWTKNPWLYEIAFREMGITVCPENFTIILSSQYLNTEVKIPARFTWFIRKTFTVYTAEYLLSHNLPAAFINCGGRRCKECQRCYINAARSEINIRELLKKDTLKMEKAGFTWTDSIPENISPARPAKVDFSALFI